MGIFCLMQGAQTNALWEHRGDQMGGERGVQEEGDICITMTG